MKGLLELRALLAFSTIHYVMNSYSTGEVAWYSAEKKRACSSCSRRCVASFTSTARDGQLISGRKTIGTFALQAIRSRSKRSLERIGSGAQQVCQYVNRQVQNRRFELGANYWLAIHTSRTCAGVAQLIIHGRRLPFDTGSQS